MCLYACTHPPVGQGPHMDLFTLLYCHLKDSSTPPPQIFLSVKLMLGVSNFHLTVSHTHTYFSAF